MKAETMEPVIGVEVHAQLLTRSKLFCPCPVSFGEPPNSNTCPVCLGHPGTLPVLNGRALEMAAAMALACGCRINHSSRFARKHYFYPDLPKGYQITQYAEPLAENGVLEIKDDRGEPLPVAIERIHLEEDAGKLLHDPRRGRTHLDFNRAGVPLIEIVSRPRMGSPEETIRFLTLTKAILEYLGICSGRMEEGSLRCDVNISLRPAGSSALGPKAELKNLNSFRAVRLAIAEEIRRQSAILSSGGVVTGETRRWDPDTGRTVLMRSKEEAPDYRYFPEPDLPPAQMSEARVEQLKTRLPELPGPRQERLVIHYGLPRETAAVICSSRALADYFESAAKTCSNDLALAHRVTGDLLHELKAGGTAVEECPVPAGHLADLVNLAETGELSGPAAKSVFSAMYRTGETAGVTARQLGMTGPAGKDVVTRVAEEVLTRNPGAVEDYFKGKTTVLTFLIGQVMTATNGTADPKQAAAILRRQLGKGTAGRHPGRPGPLAAVILCILLLFTFVEAAAQAPPEQLGRTPGYFIARTTPHFQLYAPTRYKAPLEVLTGHAEPILAEISADMSITPRGPVRVIILTTDKDVAQLTFRLPPTPEWSVGYAVGGRRIIVLKTGFLRGTVRADVLSTFRHELVHILVRDASGPYAALVPRWFNEGLAMIHTRAWGLRDVVGLSKHLITRKPLPLGELTRGFPSGRTSAGVAYAQSYLFLTHLREKHGTDAPGRILRRLGSGMAFNQAFLEVTGRPLHRVEAEWRRGLTWRYRYIPMVTSGGTLWMLVTLLFVLGYVRKRNRNRRKIEQWEEEEGDRYL